MAFEPGFMQQLHLYYAEADRLRTRKDWHAFEEKWFDRSAWPHRQMPSPSSLSEEGARVLAQDRRRWARTSWVYDLTAEARYHYFAVFLGVGTAILFPQLATGNERSGEGWTQCCSYCEIATDEPGPAHCPVCGRSLQFEFIED